MPRDPAPTPGEAMKTCTTHHACDCIQAQVKALKAELKRMFKDAAANRDRYKAALERITNNSNSPYDPDTSESMRDIADEALGRDRENP